MHAAHYCEEFLLAGEIGDVIESVHDAGVGTAEDDYQALGGFKKQGLVVQYGIGSGALSVLEERAANILDV